MAIILTGRDEIFAAWAAKRIPHVGATGFGRCKAVGIATGPTAADRLLAAFVYHDYMPQYGTCQLSGASADPHWMKHSIVRGVLAVPFLQYGCHLVWSIIPHTSKRVIALEKALGFTQEAVLKDRFGRGVHAVIMRMESRDYDKRYFPTAAQKAA